jgi:proline racemase
VLERDPGRRAPLRVLHGGGRRVRVETADYHTAGEPFRIVADAAPSLEGRTILEKRRFAAERLDAVRKLLVFEPRGHADMYGCFVTDPEDEGADLGVVFFHNAGYSTACGHGTIALVTWALETGVVPAAEPETRVVVDVPSGRLETVARVEGGRVRSVRFRNVPSFVLAEELLAEGLRADVAFGGAFYASVASPLPVEPRNVPELIRLGRAVKGSLEAQRPFVHPEEPELADVYGVVFWERVDFGPPLRQRNVTIFADGEVDRSPCGSGTSARLALLDRSGELPRGEELVHESVIGTEFRSRVVGDADVAGYAAVLTEIEGSSHRTGAHEFTLDPDDPLGEGFLLR